ncbi:MAG TPA: hypothetical protein VFA83_25810 [Acidimicrobiales bacterium]|nr:hypothetical protein [Acidimicrobiales bacterium]
MATPVYLEVGAKKVFASAVDWPGWCRASKTEGEALEALDLYVPRYTVVTKKAGVTFPKTAGDNLEVVEKVKGNATTDFGAPGIVPKLATATLTKAQAERRAALVDASWKVLADVVKKAPASLRKGPRGGGRDRDKIVAHVAAAEFAYARKFGVRHKASDDSKAVAAMRADLLAALRAARGDGMPADGAWPARYVAHRVAWHVLDHAWEIEDKSH